jgi:SAM-dependent methyltransferase
VINLSNDKDAVLREAFRVLKPGGRFAVSDVVVRGDVPEEVRRSVELWVGCIAGALEESAYASKLQAAGFTDVEIDAWRVYNIEDARSLLAETGLDVDALAPQVNDRFASAFIRARKPVAAGAARRGAAHDAAQSRARNADALSCPHATSHVCSHLAMLGAPARAIQELAGHADLTTTQPTCT